MDNKQKYNELLQRYKKAEIYMDNNDISIDERLKYVKNLQQIMIDLSDLLLKIGEYTEHEVLEGFQRI